MSGTQSAPIRLGLIGDNIALSRSPELHRIAGRLAGLDVRYDLIFPRALGLEFEAVLDHCRDTGVRGVNVTYPYKERAARIVDVDDADVRRLGAINTVVFEGVRMRGFNTDYLGFMGAWRARFGDRSPGRVAIVGAGGAGRAVAFGLAALGAGELRLFDRDRPRADAMADALGGWVRASVWSDAAAALAGCDGVVNCTPVGMDGYPGTPVPRPLLAGLSWAFDAVYTPIDTQFCLDAAAEGLDVLSGYELFLHQGVHAFELFTGRAAVDVETLRRKLADDRT